MEVQTQEINDAKPIKMFTNPKKVKKSTIQRIMLTQIKLCGGIIAFLILLKMIVPQVFDNVSQYINSFLTC